MKTILGIDPGGRYAALAYVVDGDLVDCTVIRAEHAHELGWAARRWVPGKPDVLVCERQQIYRTTPNPNVLLPLAMTVGAITTAVPASKVLLPLPREWKGSVEKSVFSERLLQGLSENDHKVLMRIKTKTDRGHILDAIGLARWALDTTTARA